MMGGLTEDSVIAALLLKDYVNIAYSVKRYDKTKLKLSTLNLQKKMFLLYISACDYPWAIRNDNTGKWSGWVNVHLQTRTQTAVISAVVYDLATTGLEYVGIGISQDNLMVCYKNIVRDCCSLVVSIGIQLESVKRYK